MVNCLELNPVQGKIISSFKVDPKETVKEYNVVLSPLNNGKYVIVWSRGYDMGKIFARIIQSKA
jgi:hypothetical protein